MTKAKWRGLSTANGSRAKMHAFRDPGGSPLCGVRHWKGGMDVSGENNVNWGIIDCAKCLARRRS